MVPARRGEPPEFLLREEFTVLSPGVQPHDHGVELSPVVALQQITRRSDSDLDQQLRVLRIHARDQSGQLRARDVVADADGESLPRLGKSCESAIVNLQELTGVF